MLLFIMLWPIGVPCQVNYAVKTLSLRECIEIALRHNLGIKIERYEPEIARYGLDAASSAYEPAFGSSGLHRSSHIDRGGFTNSVDSQTKSEVFEAGITGVLPTGLEYNLGGDVTNVRGRDAGGQFETSSGSVSIQLRQPLLKNSWIDATRLRIGVSRNFVKTSELSLKQQIMSTVTGVEVAYYDLKLAQQNVKVQQEALKLAEQLLEANRQRVEQGVLAPLDEKQAESQVASQRATLLVAQRLLAAQQNFLKSLLSDDMSEWKDVLIEPSDEMSASESGLNREQSWVRGLTLRPDLLQARLDLERLGLVLKFQRNQLYPQVDLVGSYGFTGAEKEYSGMFRNLARGNSPFYSFGAVLTIPLGNRTARSNYKISRAEQRQALIALQQLEQTIMLQIEDAVNLARTNFERVGTTREARRFAEAALEAEQTKLENGKSMSFFILQLQRDLTSARSIEIQALADYNKALAQLALREGTILERHNLTIETQ